MDVVFYDKYFFLKNVTQPLTPNIRSSPNLWVLTHENINAFYLSSWQSGESAVPMLVVRLITGSLALSILVWSVCESPSWYWLAFLTNWGQLLIVLMTLSGILVSTFSVIKTQPETTELPWYMSMYWLLYNVSIPIALIITTLYWTLLYHPDLKEAVGARLFWLEISTHGFNSCIALTEFFFSRTPTYLVHVYQPLGVGLWYAIFTVIYYAAGGTDSLGNPYIYEVLDWRLPARSAILIGISAAGVVGFHLMMWPLALGREAMSSTFARTYSKDLPRAPPYTPTAPRMDLV